MIKITDENRKDILRVYASELLDDMDWDTLYSFAYGQLIDSRESISNEALEDEILDYYPSILDE